MRKFMLAGALCCALGACTTISGIGTITTAGVVSAAQTACNFEPTAATIAGILSANPAVATAADVAQIICAAVTAMPTAPAQSGKLSATQSVTKVITVDGHQVTITGTLGSQFKANGPISTTVTINGKTVTIRGAFAK
jgi:hypothetical protein